MLTGKRRTYHSNGRRPSTGRAPLWVSRAGEEPYEAKYTALILLLLLVPGRSIYVLYVLIISILLLFFAKTKTKLRARYINPRRPKAKYFTIAVGIATFVVITSTLRGYVLGEVNLRDYTEAFRWVPVILIFAFINCWKRLRLTNFIDAACIYLPIDSFVSILQHLRIDLFGIKGLVRALYNSPYHFENAYLSANRILGLSTGPGQHGGILLALVTICLLGIFYASGKRGLTATAVTIMGLVTILFTQSATTFIAASGVIVLMVFLFFAGGRGRQRITAVGVGVLVLFAGIVVLRAYADELGYLLLLFETGLERHSYVGRVVQWKTMLGAAVETPLLVGIGWGKYYFGQYSSAPDNEYLFLLLVYGLPAVMLYLFVVARFMFSTGFDLLNGRRKEALTVLLFYLFAGGLVRAWPTTFLLLTKVMILVSLALAGRFWQRRHRREAIRDRRRRPTSPTSVST